MKNAADNKLTQLRHAMPEIFHGRPEGEQPRILDLEPVVEDRDSDRRTTLSVIRARDRVDDSFADRSGWHGPALLAANPVRPMECGHVLQQPVEIPGPAANRPDRYQPA
jgi:hypothetical protein